METISVNKSAIIRFRIAELLRNVSRFIKSFNIGMEVIR